MKFWASAEVHEPAWANLSRTRKRVETCFNDLLAVSSLAQFPYELRYVPIVMPVGMRDWYPTRSNLVRRSAAINCAPLLDYDVFVSDEPSRWLEEYLRGIRTSEALLLKAGATQSQLGDFLRMISECRHRIAMEDLTP